MAKCSVGCNCGKHSEEFRNSVRMRSIGNHNSGRPKGIPSEKKGKTYEEMYSNEKVQYMREAAIRGRLGKASDKKGKTYLQLYGPEKAAELIELNRQAKLNMPESIRDKIRKTLTGRKNPRHSDKMKELWQLSEFRDKLIPHLLEISGKTHKPTSLEIILGRYLKYLYPDEEIVPYHIVAGRYIADFAIPRLMLAFEADGEYWHQDKEKDARRQAVIEKAGWTVIRYSGSELKIIGSVSLNQDIPEGATKVG